MRVTFSLSGKIVCGGEYSVLDRGVAVLFPAGRATLRWDPEGEPLLQCRYGSTDQLLTLDDMHPAAPFPLGWLARILPPGTTLKGTVVLDTTDLYRDSGAKWGLGSSGAVRVLLYQWVRSLSRARVGDDDLRQQNLVLSQIFSQIAEEGLSRTSGVDLAVALTGEPTVYRRGELLRTFNRFGVRAWLLPLPEAISTDQKIAALPQAKGVTVLRGPLWRQCRDQARALAVAASIGNYPLFLATLSRFDQALEQALSETGGGRESKTLCKLRGFWGDGWYIRPCGAGGDAALALPRTPQAQPPESVSYHRRVIDL